MYHSSFHLFTFFSIYLMKIHLQIKAPITTVYFLHFSHVLHLICSLSMLTFDGENIIGWVQPYGAKKILKWKSPLTTGTTKLPVLFIFSFYHFHLAFTVYNQNKQIHSLKRNYINFILLWIFTVQQHYDNLETLDIERKILIVG